MVGKGSGEAGPGEAQGPWLPVDRGISGLAASLTMSPWQKAPLPGDSFIFTGRICACSDSGHPRQPRVPPRFYLILSSVRRKLGGIAWGADCRYPCRGEVWEQAAMKDGPMRASEPGLWGHWVRGDGPSNVLDNLETSRKGSIRSCSPFKEPQEHGIYFPKISTTES